jgi:hypothetical protein
MHIYCSIAIGALKNHWFLTHPEVQISSAPHEREREPACVLQYLGNVAKFLYAIEGLYLFPLSAIIDRMCE